MDQEPGWQPITSWHGPRRESSLSPWGPLDLNSMFRVLSSFIGLGVNGYARCPSHNFIHYRWSYDKECSPSNNLLIEELIILGLKLHWVVCSFWRDWRFLPKFKCLRMAMSKENVYHHNLIPYRTCDQALQMFVFFPW